MRKTQSNPKDSPSQAGNKIVINNQFLLRLLIAKKKAFNIYECIDLQASRLAIAYVKPSNVQFEFSKRIKEELRCKIAPAVLWAGNFHLDKTIYKVQVHQKSGPSLKSMFSYVRDDISQRDFLLLLYQLIKLIERFGSVGYVHRQINLDNIVFDPEPAKNDLFLVNVFPMRKRGEQAPPINTKFCSRAAHLGLKASTKDDLESICYILINIHTQGNFLRGLACEEYSEVKANIDFSAFSRPLPPLFMDFYSYVINLNHSDEANFFMWRTTIGKVIGRDTLSKPYAWMLAKNQEQNSESEQIDEEQENIDGIELQEEIRPEDNRHLQKLQQCIIKFKKK